MVRGYNNEWCFGVTRPFHCHYLLTEDGVRISVSAFVDVFCFGLYAAKNHQTNVSLSSNGFPLCKATDSPKSRCPYTSTDEQPQRRPLMSQRLFTCTRTQRVQCETLVFCLDFVGFRLRQVGRFPEGDDGPRDGDGASRAQPLHPLSHPLRSLRLLRHLDLHQNEVMTSVSTLIRTSLYNVAVITGLRHCASGVSRISAGGGEGKAPNQVQTVIQKKFNVFLFVRERGDCEEFQTFCGQCSKPVLVGVPAFDNVVSTNVGINHSTSVPLSLPFSH